MTGKELVLPPSIAAKVAEAASLYDTRAALLSLPDPDARRHPRAAAYHRQARAETTRRVYLRWIGEYLDFCDRTQRRERPAHPATLEAFAVFLCERSVERGKNKGAAGLAPNTVRQALSAVRTYHRLQGDNPPDLMLATGIIEGHARSRARDPNCTDGQGVPGLRLPTLAQMFEVCPPTTNAGVRDRALLSLGWAMMARRSELAGLDLEHITEVRGGLEILIRRSKTDQLSRGQTVAIIHKPDLGEMNPVACVLNYRQVLARVGITTGPFLRGVDRHDNIHGAGKWAGPSGTRLDPSTVESVIARAAHRAKVPGAGKYRGHSLRRGGATDAYVGGADLVTIARHGRWGERSPVIFKYIEDVDRWQRNALTGITLETTAGPT